jgi:hypothetical protein
MLRNSCLLLPKKCSSNSFRLQMLKILQTTNAFMKSLLCLLTQCSKTSLNQSCAHTCNVCRQSWKRVSKTNTISIVRRVHLHKDALTPMHSMFMQILQKKKAALLLPLWQTMRLHSNCQAVWALRLHSCCQEVLTSKLLKRYGREGIVFYI